MVLLELMLVVGSTHTRSSVVFAVDSNIILLVVAESSDENGRIVPRNNFIGYVGFNDDYRSFVRFSI